MATIIQDPTGAGLLPEANDGFSSGAPDGYETGGSLRDAFFLGDEDHARQYVRSIFSDLNTMGGHWRPTDDRQIFDDEEKAEIANRQYVAFVSGTEPEAIMDSYPTLRDEIALEEIGNPYATEREFYDFQRNKFLKDQAVEAAVQSGMGAIAYSIADSPGGGRSLLETINDWSSSQQLDPEVKARAVRQVLDAAYANEGWMRRVAPEGNLIFKVLGNHTGVLKDGGPDIGISDLGKRLASMREEDRFKAYALAALLASHHGDAKGFWKQLGESLSRSVTETAKATTLFFAEGALEGSLSEARRRGRVLVGEDGKPVNSATTPGYNTAMNAFDTGREIVLPRGTRWSTDEERDAAISEWQSQLDLATIIRELNQLATGEIDPIKPIATGWLAVGEQGTYAAAGSLPFLAVAAIPYAGVPLAAAAYTAQEYDRIRATYRDVPIPQAQAMALISGGVQAGLDKLQVHAVFGKLPMTGTLLEEFAKPGRATWQRMAFGSGLSGVEQSGQELTQNLTPLLIDSTAKALGADMPEYDWRRDLQAFAESTPETFFALLPFWLLGSGAISFRELKRGEQFRTNIAALKEFGISEDEAKAVANAPTIEETDKAFREAWRNLSFEKKQAIVATATAGHRETEQRQAAPADLTFTKVGEEFVITNAEGRQIYRSRDVAEAEEAFYAESQRLSESEVLRFLENLESEPVNHGSSLGTARRGLISGTQLGNTTSNDESEILRGKPRGGVDAGGSPDSEIGKEEKRVTPALRRLGVKFVREKGNAFGIRALPSGEFHFVLGSDYLARGESESIIGGERAGKFSRLHLHEELLHAADLSGVREDWVAEGKPGNFDTYLRGRNKAVLSDIQKTLDETPAYERQALADALRDSWKLYNKSYEFNNAAKVEATTPGDILKHLENAPDRDQVTFVAEFLRQSTQLRSQGEISEAIHTKLVDILAEWVRAALDRIYAMLPKVREGAFGQMAQNRVLRIEKILDEAEGLTFEGDALPASSDSLFNGAEEGETLMARAPVMMSKASEDGIHPLAKPINERYKTDDERRKDPARVLAGVASQGGSADARKRWKPGRELASASSLLAWADEHELVLDSRTNFLGRLQVLASGGEHIVFDAPSSGRIVKLTKPGFFGAQAEDAGAYLQRMALGNRVFGDDVKFEGIVTLPGEEAPRAVISQPFIEGRDATIEEQKDYLMQHGFVEHDGKFVHPVLGVTVWDTITNGNVIAKPDGTFQAIDLQLEPSTSEDLKAVREKSGIGRETVFSKGGTKSDATIDQVNSWVGDALRNWRSDIRVLVHDSAEAIPDEALRKAVLDEGGNVEGFYNPEDGSIHIIADQMGSQADVQRVLRHEGMHWAFANTLRDEYRALLSAIKDRIPGDKLEELSTRYRNASDDVLVEEHLAYLGQNNPQSSVWRNFVYEAKRILRKVFGDRVEFTDADVLAFLSKANRKLTSKSKASQFAAIDRPLNFAKRDSHDAIFTSYEAREWYETNVAKIDTSGEPTEALARKIVNDRNALKIEARKRMADKRKVAYLEKYYPIHSFEFYYAKYSARGLQDTELWKTIIDAGRRPNQEVTSKVRKEAGK